MSQRHTVEKVGGTSMAATDALFDNILIGGRTGAALYNRIFVVSAYAGMTDLLLSHKKTGASGVYEAFARAASDQGEWQAALGRVEDAMLARNAGLFSGADGKKAADAFVRRRIAEARDWLTDLARLRRHGRFHLADQLLTIRELLAGLGEAHSARNTAALLRERGVNAECVDLTAGGGELLPLDDAIATRFRAIDLSETLPIVTGYAACREGMVARFDRGYSEMTFSRIAVLTGAREAIIHKEFHLSSADPKLVGEKRARKIGHTNYEVADQLANLGMEAIHPGAGRGLRQTAIPLRVRNTFDPEDAGTLISGSYVSDRPRVEIVTGLARVQALQFFEQDMVGVKGYDAAVLKALTEHRLWIVSKCSNANTITHYLSCSEEDVRPVTAGLARLYPDAEIGARPVAIVSVIGSDLTRPTLVGEALAALGATGIAPLALQHQIRNVEIQFIVEPADFEPAVRALHAALIETPVGDRIGNKGAETTDSGVPRAA